MDCPVCGDEFEGDKPLQQHMEAKHPEVVSSSKSDWMNKGREVVRYAIYGAGALAAAFVLAYWVIPWMNQPASLEYPSRGDHWHASYEIVLCGEKVPQRPYSQGDVHTHGKGQIHVHPHSSATAGESANLGAFFESFDGELTDTRIAVPLFGTYENGDNCNGEPGEVVVYANGSRVEDPDGYVPQDGDNIRITFES